MRRCVSELGLADAEVARCVENAQRGKAEAETETARKALADAESAQRGGAVRCAGNEFCPRGGEDDWRGTDVAVRCHTTMRFLTFAYVTMLWVSMVMRLYWRLSCFWRMV